MTQERTPREVVAALAAGATGALDSLPGAWENRGAGGTPARADVFPYPAFVLGGKSLAVIADGAPVVLHGTLRVASTTPGQTVHVSGFRVLGIADPDDSLGPLDGVALLVEDTEGPVRFTDCTFLGAPAPAVLDFSQFCPTWLADPNGSHAAWVLPQNADVAFARCVFEGGQANGIVWGTDWGCISGGRGGDGLRVEVSTVVLAGCSALGGGAGAGNGFAGPAGDGVRAIGSRMWSTASTFTGGSGGVGETKCSPSARPAGSKARSRSR